MHIHRRSPLQKEISRSTICQRPLLQAPCAFSYDSKERLSGCYSEQGEPELGFRENLLKNGVGEGRPQGRMVAFAEWGHCIGSRATWESCHTHLRSRLWLLL